MRRGIEGRADIISYLITENRCRKVAEIGVWKARTTRSVLHSCSSIITEYWAVDNWLQINGDELYKHICRFLLFYPQLKILRMSSVDAAKLFDNYYLKSKRYFDIVFIDADHSYESVKEDISVWLPHVKIGGLITGHDYGGRYKGVKEAVDGFFDDVVVMEDVWIKHVNE